MTTKIRMWEFVGDDAGNIRLQGVIRKLPPWVPKGSCGAVVDVTIRTSLIVRVVECLVDPTVYLTINGRSYELEGPSRIDMIAAGNKN